MKKLIYTLALVVALAGAIASSPWAQNIVASVTYFTLGMTLVQLGQTISSIAGLTLTGSTLVDPVTSTSHVSTANFSSTGTGLASVTGLSQSLTAGGLYECDGYIHFTTAPTSSNGFKIALATSDTLTVTQMVLFVTALNNAAFVVSGTGTSIALGTAADNVLAAATDLLVEAVVNVNAAGTLQVQLAENTASGTIASNAGNARWRCGRAS